MENYILIQELPDAHIGTNIIWDEKGNHYKYEKCVWISFNRYNYLTADIVTQNPKWFIPESKYWDTYIWHNPTYNRKEVCEVFDAMFDNTNINILSMSTNDIKQKFASDLRQLGKVIYETKINKP